ncbi:hypothetical protein CH330_02595 [candidate division WOR-3 bacterium JGI_Cruoil_03_51_56]|uniref:Class II aldolase/adducin N-terminal domain-containing protein n=1 Tax=candidate division WOR-3 bacterium JGI_Cruoil_03_51_56 TaxID=1973747 RepID=A0A235BWM4_UNCW3|nr:MAG: hypothetical protein CH330_02595 [candidate division WOR-3 bacterium JGI_Cruoil_03_51_56]
MDLLTEVATPYLAEIAAVAEELDRKGWAEANAGNLSFRLNDIPLFPGKETRLSDSFPQFSQTSLLITAAGVRMRDLARNPLSGLCLVRFNNDGTAFRTLGNPVPTSELPAHIAAHSTLMRKQPCHPALVHTHPTALIALTLLQPEPESLLSLLGRSHSEMALFRDKLTMLPFLEPGSENLAKTTGKALEKYSGIIWPRHGMVASGTDFNAALDLIQICDKAAEIALLSKGKPMQKGRSLKGWNAPDGIETFYEVRSQDSHLPPEEFARLPRRPVHIILDNLRSAFNVGSIFRLADAARIAEIIPCGYTAYPPNHKLEQTALKTTDSVPWCRFQETTQALKELKKRNIQLVAVETAEGAIPFHRFDYHFPVAVIFGNERLGISQSVLRLCDGIIDIPVYGYKNSINVAAAAGIVLYHLLRTGKWLDR